MKELAGCNHLFDQAASVTMAYDLIGSILIAVPMLIVLYMFVKDQALGEVIKGLLFVTCMSTSIILGCYLLEGGAA